MLYRPPKVSRGAVRRSPTVTRIILLCQILTDYVSVENVKILMIVRGLDIIKSQFSRLRSEVSFTLSDGIVNHFNKQ